MRFSHLAFIVVHVVCCGELTALAEAPAEVEKNPEWKTYCDLSARMYSVQIQGRASEKVVRSKDPVFVHTIEVGVEGRGIVYLWTTEGGRPVAVITSMVHRYHGKTTWDEMSEFHSLYDTPIMVKRGDQRLWTPQTGIERHELEDAPQPAKSLAAQLSQAKALSREFAARAIYHRADGKEWKLRLLPTPVHKYETGDAGQPYSGFLFVFCRSNDPELFLKLEVKKYKSGKRRWTGSCASFTDAGVIVSRDGQEFWSENPARFSQGHLHFGYSPTRDFNLADAILQLRNLEK